jgi:hypothetical protein
MNLKHLGFSDFLEEEEIITSIFRRSFSKNMGKIILNIIIFGGLAWLIHFYLNNYDYKQNNILNYAFLVPIIGGLIKISREFMKWYGNAILMTNESLVFAEFYDFFDRKISRLDYWDLDDVELEKKGVGDYLGNKGDLIFTKVSGGTAEEFKRINNPRKIIRKIRKYKEKVLDEKNFTEESALKDLLSKLVQTHVRHEGQPKRNISSKYIKENPAKKEFKISPLQKIKKRFQKHHFHNELEDENIKLEIEKEMDDEGGLEIEL